MVGTVCAVAAPHVRCPGRMNAPHPPSAAEARARQQVEPDPARSFDFRGGRMLFEWWGVLLAASLGVLLLNWLAPPVRLDNLLYDMVQRLNPPPASGDIVIVAIDNRSLAELGRWPWPRSFHAQLIATVGAQRPRIIGYDVLFPDPSPEAAQDDAMAGAMAAQGRVVLPYGIDIPGADGAPSAILPPVAALAEAAAGQGHVLVRPDRDGVVRGIDRLEDSAGRRLPQLAETLAGILNGMPAAAPARDGEPVLAPARDLLRFARGPGGYRQIAFVDAMLGRLPDGMLEDRIILVGWTASGMGDRFSTPMSATLQTMPGVELNANYLDGLLNDRLVRPASPGVWQAFSVLPVWLLMASLLLLGPRINIWVGLGLSALVLAVTFTALGLFRFWLPPASALIAIGLVYPLWGWRRLDLASRYMLAELRDLSTELTPLPRVATPPSGDPVERQIQLMHDAIRDVRTLRRFVAESLDSLPDAALVTDLDGTIMIANDAADRLFDERVDGALPGRPIADVFGSLDADPRMADPRATALLEAMRTGRLPPDHGYEVRTTDGISLEVRLAFFTDDRRRPMGWIARFADITDLRASERQREDALRLLTHDMRAPQASILALLHSGQADVPPELGRRLERYARQTLSLADDFVNLARAESGQYVVERFNLSDALMDAADDLWPLADAKQIRIETEVPDGEALVLGDRALLSRAIANLMGNAVKYSEPGTRIRARLRLIPGMAEIAIADQGRGIAAEELDGLFAPFRRLAAPEGAAPGSDAPGAGLGLAFVKAVVERHRGSVRAESQPGRGSVFTMAVPVAGDGAAAGPASLPVRPVRR